MESSYVMEKFANNDGDGFVQKNISEERFDVQTNHDDIITINIKVK